jgi:hypothetical protein
MGDFDRGGVIPSIVDSGKIGTIRPRVLVNGKNRCAAAPLREKKISNPKAISENQRHLWGYNSLRRCVKNLFRKPAALLKKLIHPQFYILPNIHIKQINICHVVILHTN